MVRSRNLVWTLAAALGPAHLDFAWVVPEQEAHQAQPVANVRLSRSVLLPKPVPPRTARQRASVSTGIDGPDG